MALSARFSFSNYRDLNSDKAYLSSLQGIRECDYCVDTEAKRLQVQSTRVLHIPSEKILLEELRVLH
jgi:hypothetical protein